MPFRGIDSRPAAGHRISNGGIQPGGGTVAAPPTFQEPKLIAESIAAVSREDDEVLALSETHLQIFSAEGEPLSTHSVPVGVSAALRNEHFMVLGFDNGFIEIR